MYLGLFTLGSIVGAFSTTSHPQGPISTAAQFLESHILSISQTGVEANACIPNNDTDIVFFVSCGGIY